jgi:DNA-binding MarR family transcriptional regulator
MPVASANITDRRKGALPRDARAPRATAQLPGNAFGSLIKTLGLLKRVMEPHFAQFGISSSQWGVLHALHCCEQDHGTAALRLTDLGDRLIVRPASITGTVDRLQRLGLVARTASPSDHRAKHVTLTETGRGLVCKVLQHHPAQVHRVLEGLTAPEQADLQRLLERLVSHLEPLAAAIPSP